MNRQSRPDLFLFLERSQAAIASANCCPYEICLALVAVMDLRESVLYVASSPENGEFEPYHRPLKSLSYKEKAVRLFSLTAVFEEKSG